MLYKLSDSQKAMALRKQGIYTVLLFGTKVIGKRVAKTLCERGLDVAITSIKLLKDHKRNKTKALVKVNKAPAWLD